MSQMNTNALSAPWADHPECDHLMKWGTHDENGCSLCSCLTAAPTEEGERVMVWHEAVEAMREIVSYLRSEYQRYRFPVPEHYVDTVEAALNTPTVEPATAASQPVTASMEALVAEGIEAVRLTREYVGEEVLPEIEGWSWYDWTQKAKAALQATQPAGQRCKHDGTLVDLLTVAKTKYPAGSPEWDAVTQLVFNIEDHLDCLASNP